MVVRAHLAQGGFIRWASNAALSNNGGDIGMWSDIKGRIRHLDACRSDRHAAYAGYFIRIALLNRDMFTREELQVNARARCDDVEWNRVRPCQNSHTIGSNLVS